MKVSNHTRIYFCVVSLLTGFLTMARSKPVSAVSAPAPTSNTTTAGSKLDRSITPPNPNSRSEMSPLSKAMESLDIRPFSLDNSAHNLDMPESRYGSNIRSKLVQEETSLEDMIVDLILDGQWEVLQPNSGKSIVLGNGKSVSVSYQEEPGSGYRTWEWHGHVMVYEDGEGYVPEYVYGNYFEPLEDENEPDFISMNNMNSMCSVNPRLAVMHCDLSSLNSVKQFVDNFRRSGRPLDVLVCNAAVYLPTAKEPRYTADGFELSVGTNHLGHFLLANLLMEDIQHKENNNSRRVIIVGSITGNTNTVAGNVPPKANLGDLRGLAGGLDGVRSSVMIDGGEFDGAKAYKDSKVCNMLTMQEMHRRFHEKTGVTFASLYPGCIATTGLFREHYSLFRTLFPPFQKYITKGYVSEEESGRRLAQVVSDPSMNKSGVYWSWNNQSGSFENELSQEASDAEKAKKLWEVSEKLVGLA